LTKVSPPGQVATEQHCVGGFGASPVLHSGVPVWTKTEKDVGLSKIYVSHNFNSYHFEKEFVL